MDPKLREAGRLCADCDEPYGDEPHTITRRGRPYKVCQRCSVIRARGTMTAVVLEGPRFDWEAGARAAENVVGDDGEINYWAAASADPGVMACPSCGVYHWREGTRVRCANCAHEWTP